MGTLGIADVVDGKNRYPEQMGIIGLGNRSQGTCLMTMGTGYLMQNFGLLFAWSGSEK